MHHFILFTCLVFFGASLSVPAEADEIERFHQNDIEKEVGYSALVKAGDFYYLSGVVANGELFEEQVKRIYASIGTIAAKQGLSFSNIVKETVFTRDMPSFKKLQSLRKDYYQSSNYPAATWVQVTSLYDERFDVEIEVIFYKHASEQP